MTEHAFDLEGEAPRWGARSTSPEGFIVEELPLDDGSPDPAGTHVWFTVEKRGLATTTAARAIARALGRDPQAVGFAGRKDAVAITRQRMSIEHVTPDELLALDLPGIRVRDPYRCRTKLRVGALEGNRFHLRLDDAVEADRTAIAEALRSIAAEGVPNAYGPQRFGRDGRGWEIGRALVVEGPLAYFHALAADAGPHGRAAALELLRRVESGTSAERRRATELCAGLPSELAAVARQLSRRRDSTSEDLVRAIPRRAVGFHLAMLQAHVFNIVLAERLAAGTARTLVEGDVPERVVFGGTEELVPSGPMWAPRMTRASGDVAALEERALAEVGVTLAQLEAPGGLHPRGARRPLVVPVRNPAVEWRSEEGGDALWLSFELPVGSYATVVLEELRARVP